MLTLYGIPNCDTVKKARKWLEFHNVNYQFHDFRKDGLEKDKIREWLNKSSWQNLVNKRSTTWRGLTDKVKENMNNTSATHEILQQPTLVKRPVVESGSELVIGFNEKSYKELINQ